MYQIGESFTRLRPQITHDQVWEGDRPETCVLGEPPERFRTIHCMDRINLWNQRLRIVLANPVEIENHRGHRRVSILGSAIFDRDSDGIVRAYRWDFDENNSVYLAEIPDALVVVERPPYQSQWIAGYERGLVVSLLMDHPGQTRLCQAYAAWAARRLLRLHWTASSQTFVREQIANALAMDPIAIGLAHQIQLSPRPRTPVRLDAYNHVIRFRAHYQTLQVEAPQLIPLYGVLAPWVDPSQEVTEELRRIVVSCGITPAFWRLLCREGTAWMRDFFPYYIHAEIGRDEIQDLLTMAQAFGTEALVPDWLLNEVMTVYGHPNSPMYTYVPALDDLFPLCQRLGHILMNCSEEERALLQDRARDIFHWACESLPGTSRRTVRIAKLPWFVRQASQLLVKEQLALDHQMSWDNPFTLNLNSQDVYAVVLNSPVAIWQEGQTMHHCAASYIERCMRGDQIMVSIRSHQKVRPLATVTFSIQRGKVRMTQISGFANCLVDLATRRQAHVCRRQMQAKLDSERHQGEVITTAPVRRMPSKLQGQPRPKQKKATRPRFVTSSGEKFTFNRDSVLDSFAEAIDKAHGGVLATWPRPGNFAVHMGQQMRAKRLRDGLKEFVLGHLRMPDDAELEQLVREIHEIRSSRPR